eukprot:TRINITY_DN325_c0_g1_i1.p1 TRINITY_DN325_c0_g1~~TRINITY_DN325_c0_g1_i1.p1  ORF type:complete len:290 (-),score=52.60 TRINITY_DN325_c0_g1_i1:156-1025(-)
MKVNFVVLLLLLVCVLNASTNGVNAQDYPISLGDRLIRDFTKYIPMPITVEDAEYDSWQQSSSGCDPNLGIAYTQYGSSATTNYPITLYFTQSGLVAGMGVTVFGSVPASLVQQGFWQQLATNTYYITLTFRDPSQMCTNNDNSTEPLGDRIIINAGGVGFSIPMLEETAISDNWTPGSCFYGMGRHYFYDLVSAPNMSWIAGNLMPVVAMYANGTINAIFFATTSVQQVILPKEWDGFPLPNFLMCKNWCDSSCTFSGTHFWSTMHIYFRDYTQAHCAGGCTIGCCNF